MQGPGLAPLPNDDLPSVEPSCTVSLPQGQDISSVILSPDGATAYANVHATTFDIASALNDYGHWPGLTLGALLLLAAGLRLAAVLQNPRKRGLPYCRKCNYCLEGTQPNALCPECGADTAKTKPIKGRSPAWRIGLPVTILVLAVALSASSELLRRGHWTFTTTRWHSMPMSNWLAKQPWSKRIPAAYWLRGETIVAVDTATGAVRELTRRAAATSFRLAVTPDGSGLYVQPTTTDGIEIISTKNGAPIARLTCGADTVFDTDTTAVIGHSADNTLAWLSAVRGAKRENSVLIEWNPSTGEWRDILELANVAPSAHRFAAVSMDDTVRFIMYQTSVASRFNYQTSLDLYDLDGNLVNAVSVPRNHTSAFDIAASANESILVLRGPNVRDGAVVVDTLFLYGDRRRVVLSQTGNYVAFPSTEPRRLLIARPYYISIVDNNRYAIDLLLPHERDVISVLFSNNGLTVAAIVQPNNPPSTTAPDELVLWRLPEPGKRPNR